MLHRCVRIPLLLVLLAAPLGLASAASAGGAQAYPGAFCQPLAGAQADDFTTSSLIAWTGAGTAQVSCPILRRKASSTKPLRAVEIRVDLAAGTISCRLVSTDANGFEVATQTVTSSGPGPQTLAIVPPGPAGTEGGVFHLDCELPQNGGVLAYFVTE